MTKDSSGEGAFSASAREKLKFRSFPWYFCPVTETRRFTDPGGPICDQRILEEVCRIVSLENERATEMKEDGFINWPQLFADILLALKSKDEKINGFERTGRKPG